MRLSRQLNQRLDPRFEAPSFKILLSRYAEQNMLSRAVIKTLLCNL